jgi:hypothetical protein
MIAGSLKDLQPILHADDTADRGDRGDQAAHLTVSRPNVDGLLLPGNSVIGEGSVREG